MNEEEYSSGIPTRAIHESYLAMQQALRQYRGAKDATDDRAMSVAHGELQQSVLTFYELLRPHLRHQSALKDWWEGKLPPYKHNEGTVDPDEGRGVLQVQTTYQPVSRDDIDSQEDEIENFKELHDVLGLNGNVRVVGASPQGDTLFLTVQQYQLGLRHLDDWDTKYVRKHEAMGGFMSDKTRSAADRQRIPVDRLIRAARELGDVADKLGALSDFDVSDRRVRITDEQIDRLEKWRKENVA